MNKYILSIAAWLVALGLSALAVPVRSPDGSIAGALSVAGLTPQMQDRGKPVHLKQLQAAAARIEAGLGGDARSAQRHQRVAE